MSDRVGDGDVLSRVSWHKLQAIEKIADVAIDDVVVVRARVVAGACCFVACHEGLSRYSGLPGEMKHLSRPRDEVMGAIVADDRDVDVANADESVAQVVDEDHGGDRHRAVPKEDACRCTIVECRRWRRV